VIGDSPLNLNLQKINVSGTFQMGTPTCPIQSLMNVFIPGGDSTFGIFAMRNASYDVHGAFTVSATYAQQFEGNFNTNVYKLCATAGGSGVKLYLGRMGDASTAPDSR
jgi:hypothetical protein